MAVGLPMKTTYANGDVFSASDVNDITGTVNLVGQTTNFYAGKNKIINGDFGVWQRGTSISLTTGTAAYTSDRWNVVCNFTAGSASASQQTFTPGTAPVSGYEGTFFHRVTTGSTSTYIEVKQNIENVRTYAGQTVILSFWAKASTAMTSSTLFRQEFGTGGSALVDTSGASLSITTSWTRFTTSVTLPSISGKTIGTNSMLRVYPISVTGTFTSATVDIWGVQLEAGSTATAFQTATGTVQGELAACQRYYYRNTDSTGTAYQATGQAMSTTVVDVVYQLPVSLRVNATALETSNMAAYCSGATRSGGTFTLQVGNPNTCVIRYTHGSAVFTNGASAFVLGNAANCYIGLSAEL